MKLTISIKFPCIFRDNDGIQDNIDNCPDIPNNAQQDTDRDGQGKKLI